MALEKPRYLFAASAQGQGDAGIVSILALQVLSNARITLSRAHVSGVRDDASARSNSVHALFETASRRSHYENAPGGAVVLDVRLLRALAELSRHYTFTVSELAGGSHCRGSDHYAGVAFDVNILDGARVGSAHPSVPGFMADCRALGARRVIGPPARGHETHVHAGW